MRSLVAVVVLAGCRLHFDERTAGDAGGIADGDSAVADAAPLALACNAAVRLDTATAAAPKLSATATDRGIFAVWMEDDGSIGTQGARLPAPALVLVEAPGQQSGPWSAASVAVAGTRLLSAVGSTDLSATGSSTLRVYDLSDGQPLASGGTPTSVRVAHARGLAASATGFALTGVVGGGTEADVVAVGLDQVPIGTPVMLGAGNLVPRIAAIPNTTAFVATAVGTSIPCFARVFKAGALGATASWGNTGMCIEPIAIPALTGTEVLLVRKDLSDGNLNHQIATLSGTTLTLPGEGKLANVAEEPRGVAVTGGYWVAYHDAGQLEAVQVSSSASVGIAKPLGPIATVDAYDVVTYAGEPYVLWFDGGVMLAHLCP